MRMIGAIFAVMLLAAPAFAKDGEQGNEAEREHKELERKEQEKRRKEELKKKEEARREEEKKGEKKDPIEEKIGRLVKEQDTDGDGAIGETEAKGDIKAKFGELDSNDDNKVTPEEIREYIKRKHEEEQKRKHNKQPAPKKEEPRKEEPKREEKPKKEGERPKKD